MRPQPFAYHAPRSLEEALDLLRRHGGDARPLAGGQALVPSMKARLCTPAHVVDLGRIEGAGRLATAAGRLRVPPLARLAALGPDTVSGPLGALLARIAVAAGPLPVRAAATFCGSLADAHPAGSAALAAVALGADLSVVSAARGVRTVPAGTFFLGAMASDLEEDELIAEAQLPLLGHHARFGYAEVLREGHRHPRAAALVVWERAEDAVADVRVALAGVARTPRRLVAAEDVLEGAEPTRRRIREAADAAAAAVEPAGGPHRDEAFARDLTRAAVARALEATGR